MIAILLASVLGLLALAFVLYPVYRHKHEQLAVQTDTAKILPEAKEITAEEKASTSLTLAEKEQSARNALQEVELDYQLGNIAEPEYQQLRERYMQQALVALKSRYEREQEIDEEIEEQLRKMKEGYEKADK